MKLFKWFILSRKQIKIIVNTAEKSGWNAGLKEGYRHGHKTGWKGGYETAMIKAHDLYAIDERDMPDSAFVTPMPKYVLDKFEEEK